MATLENSIDTVPCRHCGSPVRPGMIRCRECRGLLVEADDEFTLAPRVAAMAQPKCARCSTPLEAGVDDCPKCASALLDDLLKGPEEEATSARASTGTGSGWIAPPLSNSRSELRPREGGPSSDANDFIPLREVKTPSSPTSGPQSTSSQNRSSDSLPKSDTPEVNIEDEPPGLFGDEEPSPAPKKREAPPKPATKKKSSKASVEKEVETSAACAALLASLATANDANLRVEIATALGKLGDKEAMVPLERHMTDSDIRVRRAVAAALAQLGHPKGQSLLEIAERRPAAATLTMAKGTTVVKPKRSGGGGMDSETLKKVGVGVLALGIIGGGVWYFMAGSSSSAGTRNRKAKPKAKAKATKKTTSITPRLKFEFKYS